MNFSSLEYFQVLCQERNFTRASERLHLTQQSLSAHIAGLEKELGCQLIVRHVPLELTYGGVMFVGAGTLADEVSVLCGGDTAARMALLRQRAARRAEEYGGYAPAEKEKAESALIFEHKGCSVLVISDRAEEIKKSITAM